MSEENTSNSDIFSGLPEGVGQLIRRISELSKDEFPEQLKKRLFLFRFASSLGVCSAKALLACAFFTCFVLEDADKVLLLDQSKMFLSPRDESQLLFGVDLDSGHPIEVSSKLLLENFQYCMIALLPK